MKNNGNSTLWRKILVVFLSLTVAVSMFNFSIFADQQLTPEEQQKIEEQKKQEEQARQEEQAKKEEAEQQKADEVQSDIIQKKQEIREATENAEANQEKTREPLKIGNVVIWNDPTKLPDLNDMKEENYEFQLGVDVNQLTDTWTTPSGHNITLDLNGHTIKPADGTKCTVIKINGSTLNLYDNAGGGKITGGYASVNEGKDMCAAELQ